MPIRQYVDDPNIPDAAGLWRRLHPDWIIFDENTQTTRVSSAAFSDSPDTSPLSVLLSHLVVQSGRKAQQVIDSFPGYGLAEVTAGSVRRCHQGVMPTPEDGDVAHASVFGPKTQGNKRAMAKTATILIRPTQS